MRILNISLRDGELTQTSGGRMLIDLDSEKGTDHPDILDSVGQNGNMPLYNIK